MLLLRCGAEQSSLNHMSIPNANYIPVDDAMLRFENHLLSHDRVILSAKFGDGKTFFLNKFKEKCKEEENSPFEFITLYPVNYQVLENKDIFELIKHDVLLQMLQAGMIDVNYEVTDRMAFEFYVQSHFVSVGESFLSMLTACGADDGVTKTLFAAFKSASWLKSLKKQVDGVKKEVDQTELLDKYLALFDEKSVYENDIITKIIRDNIESYQNKNGKRVVLVIEDMDRLDPAHLFRIMNVFSAHMDYGYRSMQPVNNTLVGNKFGVSNVVFVMHEKNTEAIFHHFYGEGADYEGYMSKFYNKDIFRFSLAEEKEKYALSLIVQETGLGEEKVKEFFTSDFLAVKTMRQIIFALDKVEEQFQSLEVKPGVKAHPQLLKLFVIAKRLGVDDDKIISIVVKHFKALDRFYIDRLLPLVVRNPKTRAFEQVYVESSRYDDCYISVRDIRNDGMCEPSMTSAFGETGGEQDLKRRAANVLSWLGY